MKVLIISTGRTGSTSLLKVLTRCLEYDMSFEPYNPVNSTPWPYKFKDNVVCKSIILHKPDDYKKSSYSFHKELSKQFDKFIIMDRYSIDDQVKSVTYALNRKDGNWHQPYINNDSIEIDEITKKVLLKSKDDIKRLSETLNIPISYYEDIFGNNLSKALRLFNRWNLPNLDFKTYKSNLDKTQKYSNEKKWIL